MPPKKKEEAKPAPLIGRVGTNLKIGIVGLPNVGKSTFFNVLTKSQATAENFPFCTIDPNERFPNVLGCVDGTFVRIIGPKVNEGDYLNRKGYHSMNVQMICDAEYRFINCVAKWPGSVHESRIFRDSRISVAFENGRVPVPDTRWDHLVEHYKPVSKVPAFLNVVDIAGLVKGAHEGKGLGNAFLSNIKACDAIFHVVRCFDDEDIVHVEGDVDPARDLEIIHDELRLKDIEFLKKQMDPLEKTVGRGGEKGKKGEYDCYLKVRNLLEGKKWIRQGSWDAKEIEELNKCLYLTAKPVIYLVNLSEKDYIRKKNKRLLGIKEWIDANDPGATVILFSGALELRLADMGEDNEAKEALLKERNTQSALEKIIVTGYKSLNLIYFFTSGKDEVKAWTIQVGAKAPQAAGKIHTDFEKGFIMAEVMAFEDFKENGTEVACKAAGKYKQKGRDYVVEDGDIIYFKFNAGAGLTGKKK